LFGLSEELKQLERQSRVIKVGLIGAGQMGTDIVSQVALMPTQDILITADIVLERAEDAYRIAGHADESIITVDTLDAANQELIAGKFVATRDFHHVTDVPQVEVVIESTGSPEVGAKAVLRAIHQRKHVVVMNVETDVTIGPILKWYADQHEVIYTVGAGDEPTALYELYDFATALGLEIIAAGKGKNNPLDHNANPDDPRIVEEAQRRGLTPEMLVEFVDGSKTQIEMACIANAIGLVPDTRGMHGPHVDIADMKKVFSLNGQGGILNQTGVVDYVIGDLQPGVFLIFSTDKIRLRQCLVLRDMGDGPNYMLLRPFHLCSMEIPLSVAQAVVQHRATMYPRPRLTAEVMTIAKRDLSEGEVLDRIGGGTHYGMIDRADVAEEMGALPLGLAMGSIMVQGVKKGEPVCYADIELPTDSTVVTLRKLQDAWIKRDIVGPDLLQELNRIVAQDT
jgi:predicted homoserine dehydrogenase-like protein